MTAVINHSMSDLSDTILETLFDFADFLPRPFETPYQHLRRAGIISHKRYYDTVYQLEKRGAVKKIVIKGKPYLQLTKKGRLEALFEKADFGKKRAWDGKWRIIMFDIPESARAQRTILRRLLRKHDFFKLQASVFIHPYALNREAVAYLRESGLIEYIHIIRADKLDDDKTLKKYFKL